MLKSLKRLTHVFRHHQHTSQVHNFKQDDLMSFHMLQPILQNRPYLPISGWGLRPYSLVVLLNDIIINNRKFIIEFGSGISTVLMHRLIQLNGLDTKVYTVEHDSAWISILQKILDKEGLGEQSNFIQADLRPSKLALEGLLWYDELKIEQSLPVDAKFDVVLIDGPPTQPTPKGNSPSRFPALPFIYRFMADNYSIYLDDALRSGEKQVIDEWSIRYPELVFKLVGCDTTRATKGAFFNSLPQWNIL